MAQNTNALINGGFEQDTLGWRLPEGAQVIAEEAREGSKCLRIASDMPRYAMASQAFYLPEEARRVRLSGWMRTQEVKPGTQPWERARLQVVFSDKSGEPIYPPSVSQEGTTLWRHYQQEHEVPQEAIIITVLIGLQQASGIVWYDGLRLELLDSEGKPLSSLRREQRTNTLYWYKVISESGSESQPLVVDLSRYLHRPAGKHGFVTVRGGHLTFQDGTPARFWGVNIGGGFMFAEKPVMERMVARMARHGYNMARLHHMDAGWAVPNIFGNHPTSTLRLSEEMLDRVDYFIYLCRNHGIYIYIDLLAHRKFLQGDGVRDWETLPYAAKVAAHYNHRLIELQKQYAHDLLSHRNPYTGTRYVDEPTIALMEIINESSLFWLAGWRQLPSSYIQEADQMFSDWCQRRGVSRPAGSVPDLLAAKNPTVARFLYEIQTKYYIEMRDYLRSIGVKVPIAGSQWPVCLGDWLSNSHLDYIDCHFYWEHPYGGYRPTDLFRNRPMVRYPERSTIALVAPLRFAGKPLVLSEWNHCWMNEWMSEAPLLMAAYGSLQGWDAMLQFTYAGTEWGERMTDVFNVGTKPHWTAANIAAALVFHRQEIASTLLGYTRFVRDSDDHLLRPVDAEDVRGLALVKRVASAVGEPRRAVPAARRDEYVSEHRLLRWRREGVFVIDAPRTQGAVGFLGGKRIECQNVRIEPQTPFCQVVLTSLDDRPLSRSRRILLTAVARAENTGQRYSPRRDSLLDEGRPPILMEPVRARVVLRGIQAARVRVLDHHGRRTGSTVSVRHGQFVIGDEEAFWYEIEARP